MVERCESGDVVLWHGDCLAVLAQMEAASVDSIVTDPPYGLGFMGKAWDDLPPGVEWATQCLRVLKPGGYLLAFGGTRTSHRLACAIEDAGFEIRDSLTWLYGSGFPKSLNIGKAIDKSAGVEREVVGAHPNPAGNKPGGASLMMSVTGMPDTANITAPATDAARQWDGWGTALKPAHEPIVMARKPLSEKTVAANVLTHGTGGINVDGCRVGSSPRPVMVRTSTVTTASSMSGESTGATSSGELTNVGRWPPNAVFTHVPDCADTCTDGCPVAELDRQSGNCRSSGDYARGSVRQGLKEGAASIPIDGNTGSTYSDSGSGSRFFPAFRYQAKAPTSERPKLDGIAHPTVKPLALMRWLVRLVTPPGGLVLDPFLGSGTTAEAALAEGCRCVGIERDADYLRLARARLGIDNA